MTALKRFWLFVSLTVGCQFLALSSHAKSINYENLAEMSNYEISTDEQGNDVVRMSQIGNNKVTQIFSGRLTAIAARDLSRLEGIPDRIKLVPYVKGMREQTAFFDEEHLYLPSQLHPHVAVKIPKGAKIKEISSNADENFAVAVLQFEDGSHLTQLVRLSDSESVTLNNTPYDHLQLNFSERAEVFKYIQAAEAVLGAIPSADPPNAVIKHSNEPPIYSVHYAPAQGWDYYVEIFADGKAEVRSVINAKPKMLYRGGLAALVLPKDHIEVTGTPPPNLTVRTSDVLQAKGKHFLVYTEKEIGFIGPTLDKFMNRQEGPFFHSATDNYDYVYSYHASPVSSDTYMLFTVERDNAQMTTLIRLSDGKSILISDRYTELDRMEFKGGSTLVFEGRKFDLDNFKEVTEPEPLLTVEYKDENDLSSTQDLLRNIFGRPGRPKPHAMQRHYDQRVAPEPTTKDELMSGRVMSQIVTEGFGPVAMTATPDGQPTFYSQFPQPHALCVTYLTGEELKKKK